MWRWLTRASEEKEDCEIEVVSESSENSGCEDKKSEFNTDDGEISSMEKCSKESITEDSSNICFQLQNDEKCEEKAKKEKCPEVIEDSCYISYPSIKPLPADEDFTKKQCEPRGIPGCDICEWENIMDRHVFDCRQAVEDEKCLQNLQEKINEQEKLCCRETIKKKREEEIKMREAKEEMKMKLAMEEQEKEKELKKMEEEREQNIEQERFRRIQLIKKFHENENNIQEKDKCDSDTEISKEDPCKELFNLDECLEESSENNEF